MGRAKYGAFGRDYRNACGCSDCRKARRRSEMRRELHGPAYTDAAPVREHVAQLLEAGMTRHQVALLAGVNRTQVRHLMVGQNGRPPAKGLRPETARALLAVVADPAQPVEGATCDGTATRRRLQALMANGWPARLLAARLLGLDNETGRSAILQVARRDRVRSTTAIDVRALYEELADREGPSQWCRTYYRGRGWIPPLWWDDDTIDDPTYDPRQMLKFIAGGPPCQPFTNDSIDSIAIERFVDGDTSVTLNRAEKTAAYQALLARGVSHNQAAIRLKLSGSTARKLAEGMPTVAPTFCHVREDAAVMSEAAS